MTQSGFDPALGLEVIHWDISERMKLSECCPEGGGGGVDAGLEIVHGEGVCAGGLDVARWEGGGGWVSGWWGGGNQTGGGGGGVRMGGGCGWGGGGVYL